MAERIKHKDFDMLNLSWKRFKCCEEQIIHVSSNANEAISAILNFFFYEKILHAQKAQNADKPTKRKKAAFLFH